MLEPSEESSASANDHYQVRTSPTDPLPNVRELQALLELFQDSHAKCVFPPEFRRRVTAGGPTPLESLAEPGPCLGEVRVISQNVDHEKSVLFEISAHPEALESEERTFVMLAAWHGGRWIMYPPLLIKNPQRGD